MAPLVAVQGLRKCYGARVALAGIDFTAEPGEIVGLLGPNGAGKSTTLAIVATLLRADAGTVTVAGHSLPAEAAAVRRILGFVPQRVAVYPTLTATENLRFFAHMHGLVGRDAAARAARALALVALEGRADEPVARFSGGMCRRLNLACGILHHPRVILLDEPTVGVDPQSRERIFEAVAALAAAGVAILYSTHDMEEAERLCRRVVLLDGGRVAAAGTPIDLVGGTGLKPHVRLRTSRPLPADWLTGAPGAEVVGQDGAAVIVVAVSDTTSVPAVLAAALRAGGEILDVNVHHPNLADAFFRLTGRALRDDNGTEASV